MPRDILIVGGGTAGWMAASLMQQVWGEKGISITLIESATIGTVGVGEGTTPYIRYFFDRLGIPEAEWMPACNATYKCAISFPGWSTVSGFESYCHPFFSEIDSEQALHFFNNSNLRREGHGVPAHPDDYFVTTELARQRRCPISKEPLPFESFYGYHFDAARMGQFLKDRAISKGVKLIEDTISEVNLDEQGNVASVITQDHGEIAADFFVDCTGFKGLIVQKKLGESYTSCRNYLFNNAAIALPTPLPEVRTMIPSETVSQAMKYGWVWNIPLMNRIGNGYVYSSEYITPEQAESEFREHLGAPAEGVDALHLRWEPGRIDNHWKNNCVAIGLSQGFLEPLEAPMLNIIQYSIEKFMQRYELGGFTNKHQAIYNKHVNGLIDKTRDYLQLHYKLNTREDTDYWKDNRENPNVSDDLAAIIEAWDSDASFDDVLLQLDIEKHVYTRTSWYCMLAGMGRFRVGSEQALRLPTKNWKKAKQACAESAQLFHNHGEYLAQLQEGKN
jgi:hypothetical protein